MSNSARFWAVDLHTHTPASSDVSKTKYGASTPKSIVKAAIDAGLDAIAITDHNTVAWCDQVAAAASGNPLVVLPGVEISTTEGHLLAVWEEGTPSQTIGEALVRLGISGQDQGKLDITTEVGFAEAASMIAEADGIAIAAHIDKPRGLLSIDAAAHQKRTLLDSNLLAVEVVDPGTIAKVNKKIGKGAVAFVRGSDMSLPKTPAHVLAGIGSRRTWIKASRPDLAGIRHALQDPDLRVTLSEPSEADHSWIETIEFTGGFLDHQTIDFSPDLNCLLGGTGTGKSLALESIRYVLGQQVDSGSFPSIWDEVHDRLESAAGGSAQVRLIARVDGNRYSVTRSFDADDDSFGVEQEVGNDWTAVDIDPSHLVPIAAFSQGEILEYARQPVGRMSLVDAAIDFAELLEDEARISDELADNAQQMLDQRDLISDFQSELEVEPQVKERVRELSALFKKDVVTKQESWSTEARKIKDVLGDLPDVSGLDLELDDIAVDAEVSENEDIFVDMAAARAALAKALKASERQSTRAVATAEKQLRKAEKKWKERYARFKQKLDSELESIGDQKSLVKLRKQLATKQEQLAGIRHTKQRLKATEVPRFEELKTQREDLLDDLKKIRDRKRDLRRARVASLNSKTAGIVKLDVPAHPDSTSFRQALDVLKSGSRVRTVVLDSIASRIHPFRFARCLFDGDLTALVDDDQGIDLSSISRLASNVEDRNLWLDLFSAQICEMPDQLSVSFKKPEDGKYTAIEQLAHGQKCTAILVVLLADGNSPVVVDQPEDALHAPWIEEYLVDRLRSLRGERQYIFATRSPGIVVSGDAEQIVTMQATSGRGEIEATGSLERHDLNKLALHHLEGGAPAFRRRSRKLEVSVNVGSTK